MPLPAARNIVLIGMRCSGKTSLGRALAARLCLPFADLDEWLAQRTGRSADEFLMGAGEAEFRWQEAYVLHAAAQLRGHVIATGGGAILHAQAFAALAGTGRVVYLQAPAAELARRAVGRPRPPLTSLPAPEEVQKLLSERDPAYRAAAEFTIPVDRTDPILDLLAVLGDPDRP